ncbi:hypothetical protein LSTR_LSTR011094 [Laodelphax striatellus]|uniref:BTB domain-containing protein n=1 Tax=Laodelphax striatellus TaxID=195883 RepID=A0A482XH84_LAOST|nr:hypothetical protein LSTR_LSTR011094 [Laodelphax striatellus]
MSSSTKTFQERFHRLCLEDGGGIAYDCEFVIGPENVIVKGHKLLFSAASEVFKAMFYSDLREEKTVKVEDLDPEGFKGMKQFIYSGQVSFTSAIHALFTYASARKYIVPGLGEECIKYVEEKLQPSEVLELYEYCKVLCISEFDDLCRKIIQEKTDEVVASEYFLSSKIETIELFLKFPSLKLESEIKVFVHFERWALAEADRKNISDKLMQSSFNNLKKHIRFLTMSLKEFASCPLKSLFLSQEEKNTIIHNLIDVNSEPMPEYLSPERQQRKFDISPVALTPESYEYNIFFTVSIDKLCSSCIEYTTIYKYPNLSFRVTCTRIIDKYICFYVEILKKFTGSSIGICNIKSRLRTLAKEQCDDLYFVNKFHTVLDWNVLETQKMYFAKIPISKLKNETFLRDTSDTVVIEASFDFEYE